MLIDQLANRARHVIEHRLRSGAQTRRQMNRVESLAALRHRGNAEIRAAEIDADGPGIHETTIIREGWGSETRDENERNARHESPRSFLPVRANGPAVAANRI